MYQVNHSSPELEAWVAERANPKWKRKYVWKPKAPKVAVRPKERLALYVEHGVQENWDYRVTGGARELSLDEFLAVKSAQARGQR